MNDKLKTLEHVTAPFKISRYMIKKLAEIVIKPIDTQKLGEQLAKEHERYQVRFGFTELSKHQYDPELLRYVGIRY